MVNHIENPSFENQEQRLQEILEKNKKQLLREGGPGQTALEIRDREYSFLQEGDQDCRVYGNLNGPGKISRRRVIGIDLITSSTAHFYVHVAERMETGEASKIVPRPRFTERDAEEVQSLVDELLLAKYSGQIPDLDEDLLKLRALRYL